MPGNCTGADGEQAEEVRQRFDRRQYIRRDNLPRSAPEAEGGAGVGSGRTPGIKYNVVCIFFVICVCIHVRWQYKSWEICFNYSIPSYL
jgi:hypothetical protein